MEKKRNTVESTLNMDVLGLMTFLRCKSPYSAVDQYQYPSPGFAYASGLDLEGTPK